MFKTRLILSGFILFTLSMATFANFKNGPTGGTGGSPFEKILAPTERLCGFNTYHGTRIRSIQLKICDTNGNSYFSELFGPASGTFTSVSFDNDEYVDRIWVDVREVNDSPRVCLITLMTNKNKSYAFGICNLPYAEQYDVFKNYEVSGVFGRVGTELDSIGFIYRKK